MHEKCKAGVHEHTNVSLQEHVPNNTQRRRHLGAVGYSSVVPRSKPHAQILAVYRN